MVLPLALLLLSSPVRAQDPEGGVEVPVEETQPAQRDFEEVFEEAKEHYFAGRHEQALELLRQLEARLRADEEEVDPELAGEALIYLGEILQVTGKALESYETFKYAVERNNDQTISIYHHIPEVVAMFGQARREVLEPEVLPPDDPPPDDPPPPPPLWTLAPLGIPQLKQGRLSAGIGYGALQAGLGIANVTLYWSLRLELYEDGEYVGCSEERYPNVVARRILTYASFAGFFASWIGSSVNARRWHRATALTVLPTEEGGLSLGVGFRW